MKQVFFIAKNLKIKNPYNKNPYTFFSWNIRNKKQFAQIPLHSRCFSRGTREQFFCIRCIYAFMHFSNHTATNRTYSFSCHFCFILCRLFKASQINSSNKENLLSIILCVLTVIDFICFNNSDVRKIHAIKKIYYQSFCAFYIELILFV